MDVLKNSLFTSLYMHDEVFCAYMKFVNTFLFEKEIAVPKQGSVVSRTGKVHHREFEVKKKSSCFTKDLLTDPNFIVLKGTVILKRCFSEIIVTKKKLFCIFTAVFFW